MSSRSVKGISIMEAGLGRQGPNQASHTHKYTYTLVTLPSLFPLTRFRAVLSTCVSWGLCLLFLFLLSLFSPLFLFSCFALLFFFSMSTSSLYLFWISGSLSLSISFSLSLANPHCVSTAGQTGTKPGPSHTLTHTHTHPYTMFPSHLFFNEKTRLRPGTIARHWRTKWKQQKEAV